MKVKIKLLVFTLIFFIFACGIFSASPKSDLNLIIYNQNFALVSENITVSLKKGETEFHFTDIPEQLEPESVILRFDGDAPGIQMLDQKFINDVLNSHTLLEYYEGKEILFETVSSQTGERYTVKGKVIRAGREPIIETDGKIRFSLPGTPLFDALPENKLLKPSLVWNLKSSKNINAPANLSYLTGGLSWEAHYDAVGADDEDYVSLYAKFIITNNTNRGFKDAGVKLLAGETQRAYQNYARPMRAAAPMAMEASADFAGGVTYAAADDYYIFSIDRLINIASRRTEQIEFFRTEKTPVKRVYVYRGQSDKNVKINLKIQNDKKSKLGFPIPAGKVKVYRKQEDIKVFTGEDRINHTPEDEEIVLTIGSAFDLVGERKMTDSKQLTQRTREESYSITLKNRKKKAVQIEVIERLNQSNWEMVKNSHSYEKTEAQEIKFIVDLPAGSEKTVDYQIRTRW